MFAEQHMTYLLALSHAVWHHAGIGQLSQLSGSVFETSSTSFSDSFIFIPVDDLIISGKVIVVIFTIIPVVKAG